MSKKSKGKSFPGPQGPMGWSWSLFPVALSQTPAETARPWIRGQCITWCAHLLPSFRWYSLTDPGGMARWVGVGTQKPRAGVEPVTSRSQVRHRTTRPPHIRHCIISIWVYVVQYKPRIMQSVWNILAVKTGREWRQIFNPTISVSTAFPLAAFPRRNFRKLLQIPRQHTSPGWNYPATFLQSRFSLACHIFSNFNLT